MGYQLLSIATDGPTVTSVKVVTSATLGQDTEFARCTFAGLANLLLSIGGSGGLLNILLEM